MPYGQGHASILKSGIIPCVSEIATVHSSHSKNPRAFFRSADIFGKMCRQHGTFGRGNYLS